jgi:hypothetical protein
MNKSIIKLPFPGIENAYLVFSANQKKLVEFDVGVYYNVSFLVYAGSVAAEWEPQYGPIQLWYKREATDENVEPGYVFEYVDAGGLNWSQLAVEREQLKPALLSGDYQYIFSVLHRWAKGHAE